MDIGNIMAAKALEQLLKKGMKVGTDVKDYELEMKIPFEYSYGADTKCNTTIDVKGKIGSMTWTFEVSNDARRIGELEL